jgi:hypothetical protein
MAPEEILLCELDSIGLHHGGYSVKPPYTIIEIFGVLLSELVKNLPDTDSTNSTRARLSFAQCARFQTSDAYLALAVAVLVINAATASCSVFSESWCA